MTRTASVFFALCTTVFASCGGDGGSVTGPDDENAIAGLQLSAVIGEFRANPENNTNPIFMATVTVTLTNTTGAAITHHYPAGCGVKVRYYRLSGDLVFDEASGPCATATPVAITIPANSAVQLASAVHAPWDITGDSLSGGHYRVGAVLRLVGETPVEVPAGIHNIQECVNFACRYVE